jgi:hypothetical protein
MRTTLILAGIAVLTGCATKSQNFTYNTADPQIAAYKSCALNRALSLAPSPDPAIDIAKVSVGLCEGQLRVVNEKLREENKGLAYAGKNANDFTEGLRDGLVPIVANEVMKKRAQR